MNFKETIMWVGKGF